MCNPIEGCFSALKARIKVYLALNQHEMLDAPYGQKAEMRMRLLGKAAERCVSCMDMRLVNTMTRHCAISVAAATRSEPMNYGT